MIVRVAQPADAAGWHALRVALWGEDEAPSPLPSPGGDGLVVVAREGAAVVGFAEASLRHDYVNGCDTTPVLFLEGLFVDESHRRRGVAAALVNAVAGWGRARGCTEFASDASIDNSVSHTVHRALGFAETERVVYFHRPL